MNTNCILVIHCSGVSIENFLIGALGSTEEHEECAGILRDLRENEKKEIGKK